MNIDVLIEDSNWDNYKTGVIKDAVAAVLNFISIKNSENTEICFLCTNDAEIQVLNRTFRGLNKPTNVLSFPAHHDLEINDCCRDNCDHGCIDNYECSGECHPSEDVLGSIAFAFETIYKEAKEQGKIFEDHLKHLTVHSVLHLLGHDHHGDAEAEKMEELEVKILASMDVANPYQ